MDPISKRYPRVMPLHATVLTTLCSGIKTKFALVFNFDACLIHSPYGLVHLTNENLNARALCCHNSLAKIKS